MPFRGRLVEDFLHVSFAVHPAQLLAAGRRRLVMHEHGVEAAREQLVLNGAEPVRALRVKCTHVVQCAVRV